MYTYIYVYMLCMKAIYPHMYYIYVCMAFFSSCCELAQSHDLHQEAPAELKKLIAPMFHIRFVEDYLPGPQAAVLFVMGMTYLTNLSDQMLTAKNQVPLCLFFFN